MRGAGGRGRGWRRRGPKRKVSATFAKETRVPIAIEQTRETNGRKKRGGRRRRRRRKSGALRVQPPTSTLINRLLKNWKEPRTRSKTVARVSPTNGKTILSSAEDLPRSLISPMMRPSYETIRRQMRFPSILQFFRPDSSSFEPFHFVSFRFISFHFVSFSASLEIFNPSVLFSESFITRKLFITRNSLLRDEFTGLFFFFFTHPLLYFHWNFIPSFAFIVRLLYSDF